MTGLTYQERAKLNVNEHTEKKNGLTYLSWAWAVDQLLRLDEAATWAYADPVRFGDTLMVFCSVTAFGKTMTAQLPVMDHRNRAIQNPDAFQVNTAMQRCLAKAISLHGIGLYIYAGEDVPADEAAEASNDAKKSIKHTPAGEIGDDLPLDVKTYLKDLADECTAFVKEGRPRAAYDRVIEAALEAEQHTWLWRQLDAKTRSAIKLAKDNPQLDKTKEAA